MRITNQMMTNSILLSINRNKSALSNYEEQLATGKKIQSPSDDPVVAVRALKFRTTVNEISQYKTNAEDAISWSSVSEQAVSNVEDVFGRLRELSVQSSSDVMNISNRKNTVTEMGQLMDQFLNEANASYAGRYVFGGYKTDDPIVYTGSSTDHYELTEHLGSGDVEEVKRVVDSGVGSEIITANRIRTGYSQVSNGDSAALLTALGGGFTSMNSINSDDANAYTPVAGEVNFLEDTGELIFNSDDVAAIPDDFDFTYEKNGFKQTDLVPKHYFDCTDLTTGNGYALNAEEVNYQISYSQSLVVNTMAYEVVTVDMQRDLEELISQTESISGDDTLSSELEEDLLGDMFGQLISKLDDHIDTLLNARAEIGGKVNRLELTISRLEADELNFTDLMSQNEDVDFAEVYIKMSSMETVYQASLNASSKVLQPTLLDFIR